MLDNSESCATNLATLGKITKYIKNCLNQDNIPLYTPLIAATKILLLVTLALSRQPKTHKYYCLIASTATITILLILCVAKHSKRKKSANVDSNCKTENHDVGTFILLCSWDNQETFIEKKIKQGININAKTPKQPSNSGLINAAVCGALKIVQLLLKYNADINIQNSVGNSPLMLAADRNYIEIIKYLLDHNADINRSNNDGETALSMASKKGHHDIVKLLLEKGADINVSDSNGCTPLMLAITEQNLPVVKLLVEYDPKPNLVAHNNQGHTATTLAIHTKNTGILNILIKGGIDITQPDNNKTIPLILAVEKDHKDIVGIIVEEYASIIMHSTYDHAKSECLDSDIMNKTQYITNAVMLAIRNDCSNALAALIENKNINKDNKMQEHAMKMARKHTSIKCINYLSRDGTNVNLPTPIEKHNWQQEKVKTQKHPTNQHQDSLTHPSRVNQQQPKIPDPQTTIKTSNDKDDHPSITTLKPDQEIKNKSGDIRLKPRNVHNLQIR